MRDEITGENAETNEDGTPVESEQETLALGPTRALRHHGRGRRGPLGYAARWRSWSDRRKSDTGR